MTDSESNRTNALCPIYVPVAVVFWEMLAWFDSWWFLKRFLDFLNIILMYLISALETQVKYMNSLQGTFCCQVLRLAVIVRDLSTSEKFGMLIKADLIKEYTVRLYRNQAKTAAHMWIANFGSSTKYILLKSLILSITKWLARWMLPPKNYSFSAVNCCVFFSKRQWTELLKKEQYN